ncbi:MAG: Bifunctional adenosylcobalamin biosynthesis protein CobP [Hyphomicrobiaceae bacterium hypho_1]
MTIPKTFLILGGTRSGKTRYAMKLTERYPHRVYIATAKALDDEMRDRIHHHQATRDQTWTTIEEPICLAKTIRKIQKYENTAILVDCLTLWLSNLLFLNADIELETRNLLDSINKTTEQLILVSNEVGLGIVPSNKLARKFRDAQGHLNQNIAATVDYVDFVISGLPLNLKPGIGK